MVGADLVDEAGAAADAARLFDQHLAGAQGDGGDGLVAEVDEARPEEEEGEDQRDHDVVVDAAAVVGPEEVAAKQPEGDWRSRWWLEWSCDLVLSGLNADDGFAVHVGDQGVGDADGAVGLLVVLEDGEVGAADGEAAAVEGVQELGLLRAGGAVADVGAAGLEALEVGAGADLAVELLAGEPDLEVVGLGGGEAHVAGAEEHAAVGQAEGFEDGLGVAGELFVVGVGVFGAGELDQLDLLELVLADHAADVFAVAAGFGAEAGGVGAEGDGELGLVEGLVAEEVGDGDLGGGDEAVVGVLLVAGLVGPLSSQWKRSAANLGSWPVPKRDFELTM